ncbi:MAG TPA: TMEM175 family protein [Candidatus Dormibacteraeota bacterium]|nr:TMEM175 family protein [Candidatus Dormibacteraeota bacterium]
MSASRLEAFSDGVFAVAITLLVLQFIAPDVQAGKLLPALLGQWPQLATYVASFLTVGVVWVNHHTIFRGIRAVDRTIQFINLVLLLTVVLVPYPTELLGRYLNSGQNGSVAAAFYGLVMTAMAISFQALVGWALTHPKLLRPEVNVRKVRSVMPRFALGLVIYAVSIALAFVSAWLVVVLYAATAIYYAFNQLPWMDEPASVDGRPGPLD